MPPLLLLHLSDLHFGPHSRFQGAKPQKLGESFHRALAAEQRKLGLNRKVDLVFVTGDVAEAGKKSEFERGREFLTGLAGAIGIGHERFVFVPGNHATPKTVWGARLGLRLHLHPRAGRRLRLLAVAPLQWQVQGRGQLLGLGWER